MTATAIPLVNVNRFSDESCRHQTRTEAQQENSRLYRVPFHYSTTFARVEGLRRARKKNKIIKKETKCSTFRDKSNRHPIAPRFRNGKQFNAKRCVFIIILGCFRYNVCYSSGNKGIQSGGGVWIPG